MRGFSLNSICAGTRLLSLTAHRVHADADEYLLSSDEGDEAAAIFGSGADAWQPLGAPAPVVEAAIPDAPAAGAVSAARKCLHCLQNVQAITTCLIPGSAGQQAVSAIPTQGAKDHHAAADKEAGGFSTVLPSPKF